MIITNVWFTPDAFTVIFASPASIVAGKVQDQAHKPVESALIAERPSRINKFPSGETKLTWQIAPGVIFTERDARSPGSAGEVIDCRIICMLVDVMDCVGLIVLVAV